MGADVLDVERAADHVSARHRRRRPSGCRAWCRPVADARREAEAEVHQGEDVIGEARRAGVMLLDPQVGLVVQQAVEHVGRIAHADVHRPWCEMARTGQKCGCRTSALAAPYFGLMWPVPRPCCRCGSSGRPTMSGAVAPVLGEGMAELCVDQIGQRRPVGFVADVPACSQPAWRRSCRGKTRHLGQAG